MKVTLHPRAKERLAERGTTEAEVIATITGGEQFPGKIRARRFSAEFQFPKEMARPILCHEAGYSLRGSSVQTTGL